MKLILAWLFITFVTCVSALPQIHRKGKYLYNPDGERFYIRGIAYQEPGEYEEETEGGFPEPTTYVDALAESTLCDRDVPLLEDLGVNAIRVYSVDPYGDHEHCMSLLDDAGIYVIADLTLPMNGSINRASPSWDLDLMNQYIVTIDNLRQYPNILAFNIGNEVVTAANETNTMPFVKAAARDVKAYLRSVDSEILVGYASTDGSADWLDPTAAFLACDSDEVSIDLFGLNNYRWCGEGTYEGTYASTNEAFDDYPVAAYFSEFGCITEERTWTEVEALLSAPMTDNWSGGVAFQFFENDGDAGYGITEGDPRGDNLTTTADYDTLRAVLRNATAPPTTPTEADADDSSFPACPTDNANLHASTNLPPTPNEKFCECANTNSFVCHVRERTVPAIVGALTDYSCSLVGETTGDEEACDPISADGETGVYGNFSSCSSAHKLNYVISQYVVAEDFASTSCDFSGNATINRIAPTTESEIDDALDGCLAGDDPQGTFVPSSTPTYGSGGGSGESGALPSLSLQQTLPLVFSIVAFSMGATYVLF